MQLNAEILFIIDVPKPSAHFKPLPSVDINDTQHNTALRHSYTRARAHTHTHRELGAVFCSSTK